ncbi:hypothetical protein BDN70DRAFT_882396, partial [Pholiota conissans]
MPLFDESLTLHFGEREDGGGKKRQRVIPDTGGGLRNVVVYSMSSFHVGIVVASRSDTRKNGII